MAPRKIRLGVVGASMGRGWFQWAHLPGLELLKDQIEIAAVCTSRAETARKAAEITGARHAFHDHRQLVTCPDVDTVLVSVKTPMHAEVVTGAIAAGKDVYCEWPLAHTLREAERLTALAGEAGVRNFISLQGRVSPIINTVRDMVRDGYVGRVLSCSVVASGMSWGPAIDPDQTYLFDAASGATMLNVAAGHLIDSFCYVGGEFTEVSARMATQRQRTAVVSAADVQRLKNFEAVLEPEVAAKANRLEPHVIRAERWFTPTSPDQLALHGVLENGAVASIHMRGGIHRESNLLWDILGDEGQIQIIGDIGIPQVANLSIRGARGAVRDMADIPVAPDYHEILAGAPSGAADNIWRLYRAILGDIATPQVEIADFADALRRQRLIDAIQTSAANGSRTVSLGRREPDPTPA